MSAANEHNTDNKTVFKIIKISPVINIAQILCNAKNAFKKYGKSKINGINFIDRGYEQLEKTLSSLGAEIKRCQKEKL